MNFEAKLAGFVYRDGTNGEGWPDCVTVDNGGILLSEYDTRTYYPIDRKALIELADDIDKQTDGSMFDAWLEDGHYIARRIREACGEEVRNG